MEPATLTHFAQAYTDEDEAFLQEAIEKVLQSWEAFPGPLSHFTIAVARDHQAKRYLIQMLRRPRHIQESDTLAHLEVKNGKIYIEADTTEEGVGTELLAAGVPKNRIVLAFYPRKMREAGDFAVD